MKKPEKIEPNCPLIQAPCVEAGCKFWLQMERRNISTGVSEKYQECVFLVQVAVLTENSMTLNRAMENIQTSRNDTIEAFKALGLGIHYQLDQRLKAIP